MKWTVNEIDRVKKLLTDGYTYPEISDIVNKSVRALQQKMHRLDFYISKKEYYENVICDGCKKKFRALISENRKYCSSSCAATINNVKDKNRKHKQKYCIKCGQEMLSHYSKYCSNECRYSSKKEYYYNKLKNNDCNDINHNTITKWAKKYLINTKGNKCEKCGWNEVHNVTGKIPIQLNHIDGNSDNNKLSNLELLCPNCHSLTPNYGSLNIGSGRTQRKIERKKMIENQKSRYSSDLRGLPAK